MKYKFKRYKVNYKNKDYYIFRKAILFILFYDNVSNNAML